MKDWIVQNFDAASIAAIITALATLGSGIAAIIIAIKSKVTATQIVNQAKERMTYTFCPHCKKKLFLSELPFYLPNGARDDNLDGKED